MEDIAYAFLVMSPDDQLEVENYFSMLAEHLLPIRDKYSEQIANIAEGQEFAEAALEGLYDFINGDDEEEGGEDAEE